MKPLILYKLYTYTTEFFNSSSVKKSAPQTNKGFLKNKLFLNQHIKMVAELFVQ